jgi:hypothetical protein
MSNNNMFERLFKLWAMVCKLVLDGRRDPSFVAQKLQEIVDFGMFVVRSKFVCDVDPKAKVKISNLGGNFENWFLNLIEAPPSPNKLTVTSLTEHSLDSEIIAKLGGVAKAITSCSEMWLAIEKQPEGPKSPKGDLQVNLWANIFYIPQPVMKKEGKSFSYIILAGKEISETVEDSQYLFEVGGQWYILRSVGMFWDDFGWQVFARSVESPRRWNRGVQVFSRNSVLKSSEPVSAAS